MKEKMVFIVDDDRLIQNFLEYAFISKIGYSVKVFSCAEECIMNLDKRPDYIILDHSFIGKNIHLMTGLEALEKIKQIDATIPVIVLSQMQNSDLIDTYLTKGAADFIKKEGYFINTLFDSFEKIAVY